MAKKTKIKKTRKNRNLSLSKEQNDMFLSFAKMDEKEVAKKLNTSSKGLKLKQVEEIRDKVGSNTFSTKKKHFWLSEFVSSFLNPFSIVLIIIALLSILTPVIAGTAIDSSDWVQFGIVVAMIFISGGIKMFQEGRSSKASEKLKEMVKTTTAVVRNGVTKEIPISEVVPGDLIKLAAGDMIPADLRIIQAKDLFITQSALTGESEPVEKFAKKLDDSTNSALDANNLCFMGTSVSSGTAYGIVINTGKNTIFGKLAKALSSKKTKTSFDKGIAQVSWVLIWTMLVMCLVIFIIWGVKGNGTTDNKWLTALNFALSIAVGLTPEMLPMIVTLNLAKEAYKLSKQKTIVKNINSIQSFGAMDVLCTDKTGTLTEDKIVLERHINLEGDDDNRVLSYAFLNSYYQTGLKNLIDLAVIEKADVTGVDDTIMGFKKIDEIPFDFKRRRMSVVIADNQNETQLVTKGAFEEILSVCKYAEYKGQQVILTEELNQKARKIVTDLNSQGMRVIAIAINKKHFDINHQFTIADEKDMILIGFIALLDPPKESASKAISALQQHGVNVKVLTGDNEQVTRYICNQVGIDASKVLLGSDIEIMDDDELKNQVNKVNVFAKLSPEQKARIVKALRDSKHVVGFMGDGINDAAAMKMADIGISVDTAVDIAKESADIILLEKDLTILEKGVIEGRKTFCNIIKYIKMTVSSNFGNMLSMLIAAIWLPFMPMFSTQVLILNMIYDFSQYTIPWDNVDESYYQLPRKWDPKSIFKFMLCIGPISTLFDITSFLIMYYGFKWNSDTTASYFQTGWFFESLLTQIAVIYVLRTEKVPFIQSLPSWSVISSTMITFLIGLMLVLITGLGSIHFESLINNNPQWIGYSFIIMISYIGFAQLGKVGYKKVFKEWL